MTFWVARVLGSSREDRISRLRRPLSGGLLHVLHDLVLALHHVLGGLLLQHVVRAAVQAVRVPAEQHPARPALELEDCAWRNHAE